MDAGVKQSSLQDFIRSLSEAADKHPALDIPVLLVFGGGYALGWLIDPLLEAGRRLRMRLAASRESTGKAIAVMAACAFLITAAIPVYHWASARKPHPPAQETSLHITNGGSLPAPGAGMHAASRVAQDTTAATTEVQAAISSYSSDELSESSPVADESAVPKTGQRSLLPLLLLLGAAGAAAATASGPGCPTKLHEEGDNE